MKKKLILLSSILASPLLVQAYTGEKLLASLDFLTVFVLVIVGFVLIAVLYIFYALATLNRYIKPIGEKKSAFTSLMKKLTGSVPVENEEAVLTDHVYDGIRELDNNLPPWWIYMFYATIVFSGVYLYYYHFTEDGKLQDQEYQHEMVVAQKQIEEYMKTAANSIDENNVKLLTDAGTIDKGKALYLQNCAACHGAAGEGGVGPNLTDEYWIHGGGVKNVFKTIKYGIPEKGMISWKTQLSPGNIQEVSNFIMSLKGTNPPNAKAPQGEKYEEQKELASK